MKTKQVIYLGLAILLSSASLTNLPTRVSAAESGSSSTSVSSSEVSQSSTSKESTTSTSESSKSESSQSVISSSADSTTTTMQKPNVSVQSATTKSVASQAEAEPAAPTKDDGVLGVSWEGLHIIVPLLTGITVQPQLEQYIVADTTTKIARAGLSLKVSSWTVPIFGSTVTVTPTRWTWDATNSKWVKTTDKAFTKKGTDTNPTVDMSTDLKEGIYYFQYDATVHGLLGLGTDNKTSKLVKVKVVDAPVDATDMKLTIPPVIFEQASYDGTATTTPADSTGTITWKSDPLYGNIKWNQDTGRNSNFSITQPSDLKKDINTSTTNPGIGRRISASITRTAAGSIPLMRYQDIFTGGLVAKEMAVDAGGSWVLSSQGLIDLDKVTQPADGSAFPWTYQWQFSTNGGSTFNDMKDNNSDGVTNYQGTIAHITDLNSSANQLTFTRTSGFIKNAADATTANKDYIMKVVLKATIPTGEGKTQDITINSNMSRLRVTPAEGSLSLDAVPDFNFGSIPVSKLYDGTDIGTAPTAEGDLTVNDTRVPATGVTNDWTLKATASNFTSGSKTLNPVTLQLANVLGEKNDKPLTTSESVISTKATAGNIATSKVKASLLMKPNPTIQLADGDTFSSQITWDLTTTQPKALAAK